MGFLDFLKKQPPAPALAPVQSVAPPLAQPLAPPPTPPTALVDDSPLSPFQQDVQTPPYPGAQSATQASPSATNDDLPPPPLPPRSPGSLDIDEIERKITGQNDAPHDGAAAQDVEEIDDFDSLPVPPAQNEAAQNLDNAADEYTVETTTPSSAGSLNPSNNSPEDIMARLNASLDREVALKNARAASTAQNMAQTAPAQETAQEIVATTPVSAPTSDSVPTTAPAPTSAPAVVSPAIDIPDFTDEELASLDKIAGPAVAQQPEPSLFNVTSVNGPSRSANATVRLQSEESMVPEPANAVAMPKGETVMLPVGIQVDAEDLVPAKFVSSHEYFSMKSDIKAMRRSLRVSDDQLKDGVLRHEQLDVQYKRVALDMNTIQDQLMKIDRALFEE